MTLLVVDANVVAKWLVPEPGSVEALHLRTRHTFAVPDLLFPEIASILRKKCQRGQIAGQDVDEALAALESAEFLIQDSRAILAETCRLSLAINHSAYDCFYLVTAAVLDTSLVTADEKMLRKLAASGLPEWSAIAVGLAEARDL